MILRADALKNELVHPTVIDLIRRRLEELALLERLKFQHAINGAQKASATNLLTPASIGIVQSATFGSATNATKVRSVSLRTSRN